MNPYGYDLGAIYNAMSWSRVVTTAEDVMPRAAPSHWPARTLYGSQPFEVWHTRHAMHAADVQRISDGSWALGKSDRQAEAMPSPKSEAMPGMPMPRAGKARACRSARAVQSKGFVCAGAGCRRPKCHLGTAASTGLRSSVAGVLVLW